MSTQSKHSPLGYFGGVNPIKWNSVASNSTATNPFVDPQFTDYDFAQLGNISVQSPESVPGVDIPNPNGTGEPGLWDKYFNQDTYNAAMKALELGKGFQMVDAAEEKNVIAREQLAQNAKSFDINSGLQLATMQAEEGRRNAYAGGFLGDSQRSDRFKDYDLQKLSV